MSDYCIYYYFFVIISIFKSHALDQSLFPLIPKRSDRTNLNDPALDGYNSEEFSGEIEPLDPGEEIVPEIVHGHSVNIEDVPYVAELMYWKSPKCAGSIVSDRYVMSAGHCAFGSSGFRRVEGFTVHVGSKYYLYGAQIIKVVKIFVHPNYRKHKYYIRLYDASLFRLAQQVKLGKGIAIVEMGMDIPIMECTVAGWGVTDPDASPHTGTKHLLAVTLPTITDESCLQYFYQTIPQYGIDQKTQVCTYRPGYDACQGDSGSGLICNKTLVGIVSWGSSCAKRGRPGVFTKISSVRNWADDIISGRSNTDGKNIYVKSKVFLALLVSIIPFVSERFYFYLIYY